MPSSSDNDLSKSFEPTPIDEAICIPPKTTSNTTVTKISSPSSPTSRVNKRYQPKFKKECGLGDINHHIQTKKHQDRMKSAEANPSNRIDVAYNVTATELNKLCAVGGAMVLYTVKHSHSHIPHACTINIIKKCFPDSSTAKNITCDKTKAREIACNVLAPSLTSYIVNEIQNVSFFFNLL
ncbi:unnamed protein product [Rotaria magnacalcarata]|uniref:Uncharacterized protein n=1 Tax=Rotaria magnacalcarata TaxID=392030 RepID=A0A814S5N0_9BILA|nr:unnamed protein product [Rotaria magnacalcarata]